MDLVHHPQILDAVENLIGPNIQLHHTKLNLKPPASRQARFEWHQDYPFFPHTNYDLVAVPSTSTSRPRRTAASGSSRASTSWVRRMHAFAADGAFS